MAAASAGPPRGFEDRSTVGGHIPPERSGRGGHRRSSARPGAAGHGWEPRPRRLIVDVARPAAAWGLGIVSRMNTAGAAARLVRNTVANGIGSVIGVVVGLVLTPF